MGDRANAPRDRVIRAGRRMTDLEALMWAVEKDPHLDPSFASVSLLERMPDLDHLRRRMVRTASRIPRLHQKVVPVLGRLTPPEWQDDPDFDIDHHLRHEALPGNGTDRQLFDMATRRLQDPFDRSRPLWEFVVVEGLEGGRAALIQRMHHAITDGEGGIRMSEQFIDAGPELPEIEDAVVECDLPPASPTLLDATTETAAHLWHRGLGLTRRAGAETVGAMVHPGRIPSAMTEAGETVASAMRQLTIVDRSHSPLWTTRTLQRRLEVLDVGFDDAQRTAKELGGSLNDFFVTGAALGAGRYHRQLGRPVDALRIAMPVSTRSDASAGGNAFVPTRVVVPVDGDHPAAAFATIHQLLERTKQERAIGIMEQLAGLANLLPTSVLARFTLQQARTIDFATSNLRAAPFDLYIAGARIEATYPIGPLSNTACNLTMMSYRGTLNMGMHIDTGAVAEPTRLRDCTAEAYDDLVSAAR